ncbi:MAG: spore protease YyaC [Actinobacteria bacterium]|nr:spore protease YyaC [Actinomycetota bacterium]
MTTRADCLFFSHFQEKFIFSSLTRAFYNEIPGGREPIFLCIGVDRSAGDSFGPLTGTLLRQMRVPNVIGTLDRPVHAKNIEEVCSSLAEGSYVVAIDASLGSARDIGFLAVKKTPLYPGKAMGKDLPPVGDISVILNVNVGGIANYLFLQNASLHTVWSGADLVARSISTALFMRKKKAAGMLSAL